MDIPEVNAFTSPYLNKVLEERGFPVDRLLQDELELPYRFDQIKIKPNDIADAETFNISMDRLYDNFLYLASNSKLSPPMDNNYLYRLYGRRPDPYHGTPESWQGAILQTTGSAAVEPIDQFITKTTNDKWISVSLYEDSTGAYLRFWTEENNDVYSSKYVDDSLTKTFAQPISIAKDNTDYIYILDRGHPDQSQTDTNGPALYRYSITGITEKDPVLLDRKNTPGRELHKYVGGTRDLNGDSILERHRFNDPKHIICDGELVYVVDTSTTADGETAIVKVYDTRLNWINNYPLANNIQFKDIIQYGDNFLVITGNQLNEYDNNFAFIRTISLKRSYEDGDAVNLDEPKYIHTSEANPNVLYIVRSRHIEKIYYTRLSDQIRNYPIYNAHDFIEHGTVSKIINSDPNSKAKGDVISHRGNIVIFYHEAMKTDIGNEPGDVISVNINMRIGQRNYLPQYHWLEGETVLRKEVLYDTFDNQIFTLEEVRVKTEEFINSIVYNKSIGKMIFNLEILIENLKGMFAIRGEHPVEMVVKGKTVTTIIEAAFEGVHYDIDHPLINDGYEVTLDNFVHINEPFVTSVFNRCMYEIYKLQLDILDILSIHWIYEPNAFELLDILAGPCPGGIKTDWDHSFLTDDGICIVPDDDNTISDICSLYSIKARDDGTLVESGGCCIIYAAPESK